MVTSAPIVNTVLFILHPSLAASADAHSARVVRECEGTIIWFTNPESLLQRLQLPLGTLQIGHTIDRIVGVMVHINREGDSSYEENRFAALVIARYCETRGIPCVVVVSSPDQGVFFQLATKVMLQKSISEWLVYIEQGETMVALWNRAYALMARLQKEREESLIGI
jgi:hypothetical protein